MVLYVIFITMLGLIIAQKIEEIYKIIKFIDLLIVKRGGTVEPDKAKGRRRVRNTAADLPGIPGAWNQNCERSASYEHHRKNKTAGIDRHSR